MYIDKTLDYSFDVYQSCNTINHDELQYLNLLQQILVKIILNRHVMLMFTANLVQEWNLIYVKVSLILTTKRVP